MSTLIPSYGCRNSSTLRNGVSSESEELLARLYELESNNTSVFFGQKQRLKDAILDIYSERKAPGWDGEGANPITEAACGVAIRFANLLPDCIIEPDIVAEPSGVIAFEWFVDNQRRLSVAPFTNAIEYASITGRDNDWATLEFLDDLPQKVEAILLKHFAGN